MRRRWDAGIGRRVLSVRLHRGARVFRETDLKKLSRSLPGRILMGSAGRGKQMLFEFEEGGWLGIHLGMTGELRVEAADHRPRRHEHLVLGMAGQSLVFEDPRLFGRVRFATGVDAPDWWRSLPPRLEGPGFRRADLDAFLICRKGSTLKAVLLMQERFPGIGNWMADEILWRSGLHPGRPGASLNSGERARLYREIRVVVRGALKHISRPGDHWGDPPPGWLFHQRWEDGGVCPKTKRKLERTTIGGRTTCWSPAWQK